jgi:hypothetical protein
MYLDCESGKDDKIVKRIERTIKPKQFIMRGYEPGESSIKIDGIEIYY